MTPRSLETALRRLSFPSEYFAMGILWHPGGGDPVLQVLCVPAHLCGKPLGDVVPLGGIAAHVEQAPPMRPELVDVLVRAVAQAEQAERVVGEEECYPRRRVEQRA